MAAINHCISACSETFKPLTNEEAERLFGIFRKYCRRPHEDLNSSRFEFFQSLESCPLDWRRLKVELPLDEIEEIAKKTGILQLRPIDPNCKTLIIGCGTLPLCDAGGYAIDGEHPYVLKHEHKNAITVNPDLASNPTIVDFFGDRKIPMLNDQQFNLIVIESTRISDTPEGRTEFKRIGSKDAQILITMGDSAGREFSWEDNAKNCWKEDYVMPSVVPGFEDLPQVNESFRH